MANRSLRTGSPLAPSIIVSASSITEPTNERPSAFLALPPNAGLEFRPLRRPRRHRSITVTLSTMFSPFGITNNILPRPQMHRDYRHCCSRVERESGARFRKRKLRKPTGFFSRNLWPVLPSFEDAASSHYFRSSGLTAATNEPTGGAKVPWEQPLLRLQ